MLEFKTVTLEDKDTITQYLRKEERENSVCTFTNFFIWGKSYNIQWCIFQDTLLIRSNFEESYGYLPPYGQPNDEIYMQAVQAMRACAEEQGHKFALQGVTEKEKERLQRLFPQLIFTHDRDIDDYVYSAEDLQTLSGRKYHSKRNHLSYFLKNNNYTYEKLSAEHLQEAWVFLETWWNQKMKIADDAEIPQMLFYEKDAIRTAFAYFDALDCQGAVIKINGEIKAFAIGEMLNFHTAVIHVEKADPSIRGLYPAINQMFAKEWTEAHYINREEDTGEEGLRKAKLSYHPHHMVQKYKAYWNNATENK